MCTTKLRSVFFLIQYDFSDEKEKRFRLNHKEENENENEEGIEEEKERILICEEGVIKYGLKSLWDKRKHKLREEWWEYEEERKEWEEEEKRLRECVIKLIDLRSSKEKRNKDKRSLILYFLIWRICEIFKYL